MWRSPSSFLLYFLISYRQIYYIFPKYIYIVIKIIKEPAIEWIIIINNATSNPELFLVFLNLWRHCERKRLLQRLTLKKPWERWGWLLQGRILWLGISYYIIFRWLLFFSLLVLDRSTIVLYVLEGEYLGKTMIYRMCLKGVFLLLQKCTVCGRLFSHSCPLVQRDTLQNLWGSVKVHDILIIKKKINMTHLKGKLFLAKILLLSSFFTSFWKFLWNDNCLINCFVFFSKLLYDTKCIIQTCFKY